MSFAARPDSVYMVYGQGNAIKILLLFLLDLYSVQIQTWCSESEFETLYSDQTDISVNAGP